MFRLRFHADGHGGREVAAPSETPTAPEKLHNFALPGGKPLKPEGLQWGRDLPVALSFHPSARAFASASISLLSPSSVAFTRALTAGSSAAPATFSPAKI